MNPICSGLRSTIARAAASTVLTESFRNWVDEFQWSADSRSIYFSAPVKGKTPIHRLDLASKSNHPGSGGQDDLGVGDRRRNELVYTRSSVGEPVEILQRRTSATEKRTARAAHARQRRRSPTK